jgi:hypothetical protein
MLLKRLVILASIFLLSSPVYSQQTPVPVTKDPTAIALATKSIAALTGTTQIADVTLTGTATRTAGSDVESGNVTFKALGTSSSRMDLVVSSGTRSEIRTSTSGAPQGSWAAPDGSFNSMAVHNCLTDAAWFFPALTILSQTSDPNLSISYVGQDSKNGISVQHLRFAFSSSGIAIAGSADPIAILSSTDVYLDASSLLPIAFAFNTHPDNNSLVDIPIEVDFSNYQALNGVQVPLHIQKLLNGSLFLDLTVQTVSVNSGLTDSAFSSN